MSLTEDAEKFLKSMWAQKSRIKGALSAQEIEDLTQERDFLVDKLNSKDITNVIKKLSFATKILEISEKINDETNFIKYQNETNSLQKEVADIKFKLDYYIKLSKETVSKILDQSGGMGLESLDYKDTYLALYSFSSKLKLVTDGKEYEQYKDMATSLINKDKITKHELSELLTTILKMPEAIEQYLGKVSE